MQLPLINSQLFVPKIINCVCALAKSYKVIITSQFISVRRIWNENGQTEMIFLVTNQAVFVMETEMASEPSDLGSNLTLLFYSQSSYWNSKV